MSKSRFPFIFFYFLLAAAWLFQSTEALAQRTGGGSQTSTTGARPMGDADIQYDPETGSLIIMSDEETRDDIESVINTLDRPTPQVLIKVLFLEVTHGKDSDIGIQYALGDEDSDGDFYEISSAFGLDFEPRGGFVRVLEGDLQATLRAIAGTNKLEVLSRPSILTRNNQQATITVGQEVPFITNSRITSDGQTINTVQYSDVGIILQVQPRILPDRMVELVVQPEISNLTAQTVPISETVNAPVIAKRSADTTVVIQDGKTVVIGGMMENTATEQVTKIPVLGSIPGLGMLFRRTIKENTKTELLIFLTPKVVTGPQEMDQMTQQERDKQTMAPKAFSKEDMSRFLDTPPPIKEEAQD